MAYGAIPPVEGTQRVAAASRKRRLVATAAGALALAVLGVATVRPGGVGRAVGSFAETAPGAGLASASQDGSSTSGEAEKEADCGLKDLAYFTMIGNGEATFTRAGASGRADRHSREGTHALTTSTPRLPSGASTPRLRCGSSV